MAPVHWATYSGVEVGWAIERDGAAAAERPAGESANDRGLSSIGSAENNREALSQKPLPVAEDDPIAREPNPVPIPVGAGAEAPFSSTSTAASGTSVTSTAQECL